MIKRLLHEAKEQLGWQGMCGIALLTLAAVLHAFIISPLEMQNSSMHGRMDAARGSGHGGELFANGGSQKELGAFYESLPEAQDITDIMGAIYGNADAYGVQLKEGAFHLEDKDTPRVEYVMDFPMTGEYARIRLFVSHILAKHPYLALDQIDFRRERISDAMLKANVRFTLFLRPKSG